jgi:hypothetical protein
MVYLGKLSEDRRPAPTPRPSEGMVVNGPPQPTLGLDHLGGWGRSWPLSGPLLWVGRS